jgi:hypothetical protein
MVRTEVHYQRALTFIERRNFKMTKGNFEQEGFSFDGEDLQDISFDEDDVIVVTPEETTPPPSTSSRVTTDSRQEGRAGKRDASKALTVNESILMDEAVEESLSKVPGVVVGEIGMRVSRVPIERYKATTQKIDRVGIITKKVIAVMLHYIEGIGSVLCFEGKCCEIGGLRNVRFLFPIVIYSTDNEGNVIGKKLDLRILSAGEDLYKSIMTINSACKNLGGIDYVDLFVTCTDDKYQKITLNQAGPAAWRRSKQATQFVMEKWAKDAEYAYQAVARKIDENTLLKLLGMEGQGDVPQIFNDDNTDLNDFFNDN